MNSQGWTLSDHAERQCIAREIPPLDLLHVLHSPGINTPSCADYYGGDPAIRMYVGRGLLAVVNEPAREVITVGYSGATKETWMDERERRRLVAEVLELPDGYVRPVAPAPQPTRRRPRRPATGPVVPRRGAGAPPPGVDPQVYAQALALAGGDPERVRVAFGPRTM